MTSQVKNIEDLKEEYKTIRLASGIDQAILKGINRGRASRKKNTLKKYTLNLCASLLIALTILTSSVNISPAFAEMLIELPIIGRLVDTLVFVDGKASGGKITDGSDISEISAVKDGEEEEIIINFSQMDTLQSVSSAYKIRNFRSPDLLQFDVAGARMISAREDFEKIKKLDSVKDVYTLMTLDDSLIRFNIVFNYPVDFKVEEFVDPASVRLLISKKDNYVSREVYSVRTISYDLSESFGHLEEELMWIDDLRVSKEYRILKDESGRFIFEFASFDKKEDADELLNQISDLLSMPLVIEKRMSDELPSNID